MSGMRLLYDFGLGAYRLGLGMAAPFHAKARAMVDGRRGWANRLQAIRGAGETWDWFHVSSAGEYEDIVALLALWRIQFPGHRVLLTFYSPSGMAQHGHRSAADHVMYLPWDGAASARQFLDILQPRAVCFSRSELWYHFLTTLQQRHIPAFLITLRLSETSGFLRPWLRPIYGPCLGAFTRVFCKDAQTLSLLRQHFGESIPAMVTGNTRVDRVAEAMTEQAPLPVESAFAEGWFTVVAGSTLPRDEELLLAVAERLREWPIRWIVVPHAPERARLVRQVAADPDRRIGHWEPERMQDGHRLLFIDYVGQLKHMYRLADAAVIGGGHDRIGIHNILEPAAWGVPMAFGPRQRGYPEAVDLLEMRLAHIFHTAAELEKWVISRYEARSSEQAADSLRAYVQSHLGASAAILAEIRVALGE